MTNPVQPAVDLGGWSFDVATGLLIVMFALIVAIVWMAKLGPRWAESFQDDSGKVSLFRLAVLIALAVTSWQVMSITLRVEPSIDTLEYLAALYMCVWSGAKIVEKVLDIVLIKFGVKPAAPPPPPQVP